MMTTETWRLAHEDSDRLGDWLACRDQWLTRIERRSGATRSRDAYLTDWHEFFGKRHSYHLAPWDVTPTHVEAWTAELSTRLAPATVNRRLAVLASYYRFAGKHVIDDHLLWTGPNPFSDDALRFRVSRFGRAHYPTTEQVQRLLGQIDVSTPAGLRNLAIIGGMFMTTRRLTEWLSLRWCDIHAGETGHWFEYRCKGGLHRRQVIPPDLYHLLTVYLQAADNWPPRPEGYLFIRLRPLCDERPLNPGYVRSLVQLYGARAGIQKNLCHPHGLRHAGARFRRQQGATIWELRDVLGHASIAITEVYVGQVLAEPEDRQAQLVAAILPAFHPRKLYVSADRDPFALSSCPEDRTG